jgi:hypothetical protein
MISGFEGTKAKFHKLLPPDASAPISKPLAEAAPEEWEGHMTFWLKHANELTYPTLVENKKPLDFSKSIYMQGTTGSNNGMLIKTQTQLLP